MLATLIPGVGMKAGQVAAPPPPEPVRAPINRRVTNVVPDLLTALLGALVRA